MSTEDTTKLIAASRGVAAELRFGPVVTRMQITALADALESMVAENAELLADNGKLRSAENLLAMDAYQMSRVTAMSMDRAAVFLETIQRAAIYQREVIAVRAERDALQAQLDGMTEGSRRVAAERSRQVNQEGWTPEHDRGHAGELSLAAESYALAAADDLSALTYVANNPEDPPAEWPWANRYWKPTGDAVRDLEKAGGLIAAAIDSLVTPWVEVSE